MDFSSALHHHVYVSTTIHDYIADMLIGLFGGLAFKFNDDSSMLTVIASSKNSSEATKLYNTAVVFSFPILVYVTSIPVSMIIVRLNLLSSRLLEPGKSINSTSHHRCRRVCGCLRPFYTCYPIPDRKLVVRLFQLYQSNFPADL